MSSTNALTIEYPAILSIASVICSAVAAFVVWLWIRFKKSDKEKDVRIQKMEAAMSAVNKRMSDLESAMSGQSQFISAVVGAAKNGASVSSHVIRELHAQYKPTDRTGIHRPIVTLPLTEEG